MIWNRASYINIIQTALHFTASKNSLDIARKLIANKATTRKKDKRQQLPLHRAAAIGSVPMIKLFLENQSPVNATDIDGWTALHHGRVLFNLKRHHGEIVS
jgi:26S proteasome non-ATPase regulatory subunit 10